MNHTNDSELQEGSEHHSKFLRRQSELHQTSHRNSDLLVLIVSSLLKIHFTSQERNVWFKVVTTHAPVNQKQ